MTESAHAVGDGPKRARVAAGRIWTDAVGYSRAIRTGDHIEVAGTTASEADGTPIAPGDAYLQTQTILETIADAVRELGGTVGDVIRTRVFLVDIDLWHDVARAHLEVFADVLPVSTFVGIDRLLDDGLVVEIEASAIVGSAMPQPPEGPSD